MFALKKLFYASALRKTAGVDTPFARHFRRASIVLGWMLLAGCLFDGLLWILGDRMGPVARALPRQPLAALMCFVLASAGILSVPRFPKGKRLFQLACGVMVTVIALFLTAQGASGPWCMDRLSAWIVLLLGFILAAGSSRVPLIGYMRQQAVFANFFLCGLVLVGFIYEVSELRKGFVAYLNIPWTTSLFGLVAANALLFQHPNFGVMRTVSGIGFGSAVMRRLLPTSVILLLGLGWLLALGENRNLYPASFGESLYAILAITGFSALLVMTASYLNRLDAERVAQEHELRRRQDQLQAIMDSTTSIICMKDLEGRYLLVNKSFCQAARRPQEDCIGKTVFELFPGKEAGEVTESDKRAAERREPVEYILTGTTPAGKAHTHLCASYPMLDWEGNPYAICGVYTDISAIKQQEEEIKHLNQSLHEKTMRQEAANSELEAFSYSVSHDLRAPLRHISGFGQLLSQRNRDTLDEKSRHYLSVILQSVDRMGALIDDLLAFSRASKVDLSWKRISMQEIVGEVREELDSHWTGPKVSWDIGHLPDVEGDPSMLRLVWVNLLSNAMKYSGKNPAPRISVHCAPNETGEDVFEVRDNGAGFDMRFADKLFGVFQRLHSNQDYEGTGIGLAMIRRILERHGGRIWAEGSLGQGARFYFVLPTTKSGG